MKVLSQHGADVNAADADGHTPLDAAFGRLAESRILGGTTADAVREETATLLRELADADRMNDREEIAR